MAKLSELVAGAKVRGLASTIATIKTTNAFGPEVVEVVFQDANGTTMSQMVFADDAALFDIVEEKAAWNPFVDGNVMRLVSEAYRIRLAHLFDPYVAVHTSQIDPLPHQITAVYGEMLRRQPLRFLLADDPGAGKTIMTGLLIKELLIRGDLARCLIVCPGSLAEQWQDELLQRFGISFELVTNEGIEAAASGNIFLEKPLLIARLDKLSRDEGLQAKLLQTDWDLIVCDEAHKMSATYTGGEIKRTKRYMLGRQLETITRHFLLLTATPHNGKNSDFQLFLGLLDPDRFEGAYRDDTSTLDTSDLMRRMVKEQLVKFDGTRLFPERKAYTVPYELSLAEDQLYTAVTTYVREEFNRAEALTAGRKGTVGFALTSLQRRLASSPEAIYESLKRRRERLERHLQEAQLSQQVTLLDELPVWDDEESDIWDEEPAEQAERDEERLTNQATAAQTIAELRLEIDTLRRLEQQAYDLWQSKSDRKWEELSKLLGEEAEMFDASGQRRKLVIFTEHRDTLNYLTRRIRSLLGRSEAVEQIHGGMGRDQRRYAQDRFRHDKNVLVLLATDAAGEGINLQRAHLMINYDLPWNPNRLEQRFGRIHRIGQQEVCHLWNLVATTTREGEVYYRLLTKLDREREALGGAVFDVLGRAIEGTTLRDLMIQAIREGDLPEVKARLTQVVEGALDHEKLQALLAEYALTHEVLSAAQVQEIRNEMERWEARRLQPHYIASFFREGFTRFDGTLRERESGRYEITHVPSELRRGKTALATRVPLQSKYERICFEKHLRTVAGKRDATFVSPGHPLLESVVNGVLEKDRDLLQAGAVLVDDQDTGTTARILFYLEHSIQDGTTVEGGQRRVISRRLQFVELHPQDPQTVVSNAGYAPYLDYRPLTPHERLVVARYQADLPQQTFEDEARRYAALNLVPEHRSEVSEYRLARIAKTRQQVHERLTKEIMYWDGRLQASLAAEAAGKRNAKVNSGNARQRRDDLEARLAQRMADLEAEERLAPLSPIVVGRVLVLPAGLLQQWNAGSADITVTHFEGDKARIEQVAMEAVLWAEQALGHGVVDVSSENRGYDIESVLPDGRLRFIEVKGRIRGAETVTITRNEILTSLNKPEQWVLALVEVPPINSADAPLLRYVKAPFEREPEFTEVSTNHAWSKLWGLGSQPDVL